MENRAQQDAISHRDGPMLVLAGPGSGKTFVLTRHIRFLITACHVVPQSVLVITFTRAAAREMKERFSSLMEGAYYPVCFGTFHSIFFQLLRQYFGYREFSVLSDEQRIAFLRRCLDGRKDFTASELEQELGLFFNTLKRSGREGSMPDQEFSSLVKAYRTLCHGSGKLDLDDAANLLYYHLRGNPAVLEQLRRRFRYILIDEYQDINASQYRVIKSLIAPGNNLFAVGDDDQSIYAFRGSDPGIMLEFEKEFPGCRTLCLPVNFRSDREILKAAQLLIRDNSKRFSKKAEAFSENAGEVSLKPCRGREEETQSLLEELLKQQKTGTLEQCAVILRNNRQLERLSCRLSKAGIPFSRKEKVKSFFEEKEIRPVIAMLRFAVIAPLRRDFLLFANMPPRGIRRETMRGERIDEEELIRGHADSPETQARIRTLFRKLAFIRDKAPLPAILFLLKALEYEKHLELCAARDGADFGEKRERLEELAERSRDFSSIRDFLLFAEEYDPDPDTAQEQGKEGVRLFTMHGAKGLEFDTVFLPELTDNVIPGSQVLGKAQVEEERRLLYVAMTRAKHRLVMSYAEDQAIGLRPSFFLEKIGRLLVKTTDRG